MSGAEVAKIAAGLTANARKVVAAMGDEYRSPSHMGLTRHEVAGAVRGTRWLISREWQDGCASCTYYRLTPLGLAVRAYLEEQQT